jgi:hypothetical protein
MPCGLQPWNAAGGPPTEMDGNGIRVHETSGELTGTGLRVRFGRW